MSNLVDQAGLADSIELDSAGTAAHHVGEEADRRSRQTAQNRGVLLNSISRKFQVSDFDEFDYVLAMDQENHDHLRRLAGEHRERVRLFLEYSKLYDETDVPDPYYGGANGFERVLDMIEDASRGLLADIQRRHGS